MKRKLFLSLLIALISVGNVGAVDDLISDSTTQNGASRDTQNTLSWPAIPGENLNEMARAFYPNNRAMRRLFIAKTLQLNPTIAPTLKASMAFKEPILITIPTLKYLSTQSLALQNSSKQSLSSNRQENRTTETSDQNNQLNLSLNITAASSKIPALLLQEYDLLLSKNTFLKTELERLHARIDALQAKLSNLKLVLDRTLSLPDDTQTLSKNNAQQSNTHSNVITDLAANNQPETSTETAALPGKKIFKNLDENSTNAVNSVAKQVKPLTQPSPQSAVIQQKNALENDLETSNLQHYILLAVLGFAVLMALGVYLLKQYRWRKLRKFDESVPMMDDTMADFSGKWQDTDQGAENAAEKNTEPAPANHFMNTQMRDEHAKALANLEEAKLLMSVNRTQDAIDHLKSSIETQPKRSINHWLYLLEIFRKLQLKEDFEAYAQSLHRTFNVMTPVWYETNSATNEPIHAAIIVPQQLEDFSHIVAKLDAVWPSDLAKDYLHSLLTDNRDGERGGFSKAVLDEILMLITLLDTRKAFD